MALLPLVRTPDGRVHADPREVGFWLMLRDNGLPVGPQWSRWFHHLAAVIRNGEGVRGLLRFDYRAATPGEWNDWIVGAAPPERDEGKILPWYRRLIGQRIAEPEPSKVRTYRS